MLNIKINNINLSEYCHITKIDYDLLPKINWQTKDNKTTAGITVLNRVFKDKKINVSGVITKNVIENATNIIDLVALNPKLKIELPQFPNRYFNAILEETSSLSSLYRNAEFNLNFQIPEGVAIAKNRKLAKRTRNVLTFNNVGTAECYPVFEFVPQHDLRMFALVHPNGKAIQIGSENGEVFFKANKTVRIDTFKRELTIGGVVKYVNPASKWFSLVPGTTEIIYEVNRNGTLPLVVSEFEERWL